MTQAEKYAMAQLPERMGDVDVDAERLQELGYKQSLPRNWDFIDNIMTSVAALYFIGGVQTLLPTALATGGPLPTWTNWILCSLFTLTIAASLAEICSKFPTAGSIYYCWLMGRGLISRFLRN